MDNCSVRFDARGHNSLYPFMEWQRWDFFMHITHHSCLDTHGYDPHAIHQCNQVMNQQMDKGGSLVPIQKWLTAFFLPLDPHLGPKVKCWTLSPTLIEDLHDLQKGHGSQHWVPVISLLRKHSDFNYQSHLSPQGCLKYKRCSESGLNCRYQNPYIKLKLIGLAIRLYQKFWKQNESSNFSWLQNASIWITFWTLHVKANFVFRLFNVFLRFQGRSTKNICLRFAIFNFSKKLQNISETRLKNMEWLNKNSSWKKKKYKIPRRFIIFYMLN